MLVPFSWLKEFVDVHLPVEEAAHALTMAGLEVEGIEEAGDDRVMEVNVTPDRPDCLSVLGIARELSAITGVPVILPEHRVPDDMAADFTLEVLDETLCPRYAGRIVRGVTIGGSPGWMHERLERCGIRSINTIVDITNYVLLEFGHPLHAFDLATLRGSTIRVGTAGRDRTIATLDGVERRLPEEALLIWDAERPVAVAGVMGGAETEVGEGTTDIFIESASFQPVSVRRTSKALGLKTEASYRFERGTDILMLEHALDRAAYLVRKLAGGKTSSLLDAYPRGFQPRAVTVEYEKVNRVLGTKLSPEDILGILGRLELELSASRDSFEVIPPAYRHDITTDVDIIEEVARLYGYDRIPTVVPRSEISSRVSGGKAGLIEQVKGALMREGFHEAVNYSFLNMDHLDVLGIPEGDPRRNCVALRNPLRKEDAHLRSTLVASLIENVRHNVARGVRDVRLFESGRVFFATSDLLPSEPQRIGGVLMKNAAPELYPEKTEGFYLMRGALEALMDSLRITDYSFSPSREPFLHPGKAADVSAGGNRLGFMGVLSPRIVERFDIKTTQELLLFELDIEMLLFCVPEAIVFSPIPKFPSVERDMAIIVDEERPSSAVVGAVRDYPSDFIEEVSLFDSYRGKGVPEGKKSLGIGVTYRSRERTLTEEEVESLHAEILKHVIEKTGGELRTRGPV
jgi:phenylalanyl-tRNA synthetase beta chain